MVAVSASAAKVTTPETAAKSAASAAFSAAFSSDDKPASCQRTSLAVPVSRRVMVKDSVFGASGSLPSALDFALASSVTRSSSFTMVMSLVRLSSTMVAPVLAVVSVSVIVSLASRVSSPATGIRMVISGSPFANSARPCSKDTMSDAYSTYSVSLPGAPCMARS